MWSQLFKRLAFRYLNLLEWLVENLAKRFISSAMLVIIHLINYCIENLNI